VSNSPPAPYVQLMSARILAVLPVVVAATLGACALCMSRFGGTATPALRVFAG
jgi:hypothetical protein